MKAIVLAEKPSVARDYARVLQCTKKNRGFFEGTRYVVTWALGHLVTLAEPAVYNPKFKEWRLEDLPMLPEKMKLKVIGKTSHQFKVVTSLMKRKDIGEFIIATDAGREGELVARWIMRLGGWRKPYKRLWISSQTDTAITEGFSRLKAGSDFDRLFFSAVCRAEADWLIGLNVTRALTCKFDAQLSAGRVQTPTLAMIINREKEIENFVPKDYWTIRADFGDYFGAWRGRGGGRLFDKKAAEAVVRKVEGRSGTVKNVKVEKKAEPPPLAYDLTELQRDANNRYGFSAQKTLSVLQSLYETHKLVTYPRTDSRFITADMVPTLPQRLKSMAVGAYSEWIKPLLQKKLAPGKRLVNDSKVTDHHAIIPTEQPLNPAALSGDERKLLDLIVRRFVTVLYPPYLYDQITVVTVVDGEEFFSTGKRVKDRGWKKITSRPLGPESPGENLLPDQELKDVERGEGQPVKNVKLQQGKTKPPPRYTEATLLTAMESPGKFIEDEELRESIKAGGLGTPATRAEIIEKLLYNFYIERNGKELLPTTKGFQLIDLVPDPLKSPELTAQWELRLSNIAGGKESGGAFMTDIRKNTIELVNMVKSDTSTYTAENVTKTKCPMCGNLMLLVKGKKGRMLICQDRKCGHRQPEKETAVNIRDGGLYKASHRESRMSKRLIEKYTDKNKKTGTTFGDILESALDKKSKK